MLEGGGLCSHKDDCQARALTDLGSSKNFAKSITLPAFQSSDAEANPLWYEANQVFLPYCGGDLHGGTRETNEDPDTWGLFFSGHWIVRAMIEDLKTKENLEDADLVVLSGGSAGGIGVFYNVDIIAEELLPTVKVLGVPIGGFLFDHPAYDGPDAQNEEETSSTADFERDAKLFQGVLSLNGSSCATAMGEDSAWKCMIPTVLVEYVRTPLLIIESQTDSVILLDFSNLPEENTTEVVEYVEQFRATSTKAANAVLAAYPARTIFSACCFMHTEFDRGVPLVEGIDYYDMLYMSASAILIESDLPKGVVDTCEGLQCGTQCPPFP